MRLNLFALHYFLWFAAISAIYGYVAVYAEHYANSTASHYGLLNMILPFVTIGSKLLFCSLADRHQAHRLYFIGSLVVALLGYGAFAVLPFFVQPKPKGAPISWPIFGVICVMASLGTIAMSVISCLSDAFAINSAKRYNTSYGLIRLWGTIGWGISALLLAFINEIEGLPFLVPGIMMLIALLTSDIVAASLWPHRKDFHLDKSASGIDIDDLVQVLKVKKDGASPQPMQVSQQTKCRLDNVSPDQQQVTQYGALPTSVGQTRGGDGAQRDSENFIDITSVRMQWILFKEVATRRLSIFRYMGLFVISGALIAIHWSFFFQFLQQSYPADFAFISGISMLGQAILGELPVFLFSEPIINRLGRTHTLSLSSVSLGLRYLLYLYLLPNTTMYVVLITESLQGPYFGLLYVVMTEVGLDYSDCEEAIVATVDRGQVANDPRHIEKLRQALRATTQSLMSACYEGLGVGIGSIVGGLVIDNYGFDALWFWAAILSILLGVTNSAIDVFGWSILTDRRPSCQLNPIHRLPEL